VSDLLDLSRIENDDQLVELSDVDLSEILIGVTSIIRPMCQDKGIAFMCEGCDHNIRMKTDSRLMKQMLLNLLTNAVKFTRQGSVTLRITEDHTHDSVVIDVADSGPGIDSNELPYVFEAFKQFTRDESAKPDGAGLGLAISLRIARMLGGTITAKSTVGKGSVFSVRLPKTTPLGAEDANTPLV